MAPDFPYFVRITDTTHFGHTFAGLFYFCLPAGLAMLWLWHAILKRPLLTLAPRQLSERITPADLSFRFGRATHIFWILLSLWIGAALHVLWDGFTHTRGIFVAWWPVLRTEVHPGLPLYHALQLLSSAIGIAILLWIYWRWTKRIPLAQHPALRPLSLGVRMTLIVAGATIATAVGLYEGVTASAHFPAQRLSVFVVKMLIASITVGFLEVLAFSAWWYLRKDKAPALSSSAGAYKVDDSLSE